MKKAGPFFLLSSKHSRSYCWAVPAFRRAVAAVLQMVIVAAAAVIVTTTFVSLPVVEASSSSHDIINNLSSPLSSTTGVTTASSSASGHDPKSVHDTITMDPYPIISSSARQRISSAIHHDDDDDGGDIEVLADSSISPSSNYNHDDATRQWPARPTHHRRQLSSHQEFIWDGPNDDDIDDDQRALFVSPGSICPTTAVPVISDCVAPGNNFSAPLVEWRLRNGRSFISRLDNKDYYEDPTSHCCICDIATLCAFKQHAAGQNYVFMDSTTADFDYIKNNKRHQSTEISDVNVLNQWCEALKGHFAELFVPESDDAVGGRDLVSCLHYSNEVLPLLSDTNNDASSPHHGYDFYGMLLRNFESSMNEEPRDSTATSNNTATNNNSKQRFDILLAKYILLTSD